MYTSDLSQGLNSLSSIFQYLSTHLSRWMIKLYFIVFLGNHRFKFTVCFSSSKVQSSLLKVLGLWSNSISEYLQTRDQDGDDSEEGEQCSHREYGEFLWLVGQQRSFGEIFSHFPGGGGLCRDTPTLSSAPPWWWWPSLSTGFLNCIFWLKTALWKKYCWNSVS